VLTASKAKQQQKAAIILVKSRRDTEWAIVNMGYSANIQSGWCVAGTSLSLE
jgi:hypothetical protein